MWSLEVIKIRNEAYAAKLTAVEVNHLFENKIYPVVGYNLPKESERKIQEFKDGLEISHGRSEG